MASVSSNYVVILGCLAAVFMIICFIILVAVVRRRRNRKQKYGQKCKHTSATFKIINLMFIIYLLAVIGSEPSSRSASALGSSISARGSARNSIACSDQCDGGFKGWSTRG